MLVRKQFSFGVCSRLRVCAQVLAVVVAVVVVLVVAGWVIVLQKMHSKGEGEGNKG